MIQTNKRVTFAMLNHYMLCKIICVYQNYVKIIFVVMLFSMFLEIVIGQQTTFDVCVHAADRKNKVVKCLIIC